MRLSEAVQGLPGRLVSDGEFRCLAFATEREQGSFLTFMEREKFLPALGNAKISCVLATPELAEKIPPPQTHFRRPRTWKSAPRGLRKEAA